MDLQSANAWLAAIGGVLLIGGTIAAAIKWGRPKARQAEAVGEGILGRPEITDRSGAVIQPAQPGMVAQVAALTDTVRELVNMHHRVDGVEVAQAEMRAEIAAVDGRVKVLEDARVEQVVSRAESAAAFSAIEAAVKAPPTD